MRKELERLGKLAEEKYKHDPNAWCKCGHQAEQHTFRVEACNHYSTFEVPGEAMMCLCPKFAERGILDE